MKVSNALAVSLFISLAFLTGVSSAGGKEDFNDCRTSAGDFCERAGSCVIQGSAWYQYVTVKKAERFSKQGWPGLCDMSHVSLIQGRCSPLYAQSDVSTYLSEFSFAQIPNISGPLMCGGQ